MPKTCSICNRGSRSANSVSHSNVKTKTTQSINLHKRTIAGKKANICTACLKTKSKKA